MPYCDRCQTYAAHAIRVNDRVNLDLVEVICYPCRERDPLLNQIPVKTAPLPVRPAKKAVPARRRDFPASCDLCDASADLRVINPGGKEDMVCWACRKRDPAISSLPAKALTPAKAHRSTCRIRRCDLCDVGSAETRVIDSVGHSRVVCRECRAGSPYSSKPVRRHA